MYIFIIIVAIILGILLSLITIGLIVKDETEKPMEETKKKEDKTLLEQYKSEQKEAYQAIQEYPSSVVRNSVAMWIVQLLTIGVMVLGIVGIFFTILDKAIRKPAITDGGYFLPVILAGIIITLVTFFIRTLARMVRKRNGYIIKLEELLTK